MDRNSLTMNIPEVAEALGISRGTCYALARQGLLPVPVIKLGEKRMVVSRRALERLLSDAKKEEELDHDGKTVL